MGVGIPTYAGVPLNGNYTINSAQATGGANFQSFSDFADSLNINGVSGNVVATVQPGSGPYTEQVVFNNISGSGPTATITIEGSGEVITALTNTSDRHIVRLSDIQYFTINNLKVNRDPAATSGFYGIHIFNTGNHITISNCEVDMSGSTSTLIGGYVASGSLTSILSTGNFHNLTFTGNMATGGGYGVSVFGLVSNLASNIVISDNTFYDFHSNGVYLRETDGAEVSNNFFDKRTAQVTSFNAIQMAQAANINARIFNNEIQVSQTDNGSQNIRGIYLFNGTGHRVYNNVIHNINLISGDFTAFEVRTGSTAPEIYFNTFVLDGTDSIDGEVFGFIESLSNTNTILRNNVFSLTQPCKQVKAALAISSSSTITTALDSDYNLFWVPDGNVGYDNDFFNPVGYPTLADWQTASTQDANSIALDPQFLSPTLPKPSNPSANNAGTPISGITTDFLGVTRGTTPDVGAYEFSGCTPPNQPTAIVGDTLLCTGASGINYSVAPVSGATSYTWSVPSGVTITAGIGTNAITVDFGAFAGTDMISVTADDTCGSSAPTSITFTVNPLPSVSFTLAGDTLCLADPAQTLSGGAPAGGTYSGSGVSAGSFDPSVAGIGMHTITYTYEDVNGCIDSAQQTIVVEVCQGISNSANAYAVVFPNPFSQSAKVRLSGVAFPANVRLYDTVGRLVYSEWVSGQDIIITREGLTPGPYMLVIGDETSVLGATQIVIQ